MAGIEPDAMLVLSSVEYLGRGGEGVDYYGYGIVVSWINNFDA